MTLPGGIRIPVGIGVEEITNSQTEECSLSPEEAQMILVERAEGHLMHEMISGRILSREETCFDSDGAYSLLGQYRCHELIGITHLEENLDRYEADRTDRECG